MKKSMKTKKSILGIITVTSLILALAGCGKKSSEQPPVKQTEQAPPAQASAASQVQEVKPAETISTTPVDEAENIILPDGNPTHENQLTLKEINKRILVGELSPTNTYYYIENMDSPGDSEKPLSSIKGIVKTLNPASATFPPSDVVVSVLQKANVEDGLYVIIAQVKNSGDALPVIKHGANGEVLGQTNHAEDSLLWRYVIPNPGNLMAVQIPALSEPHYYLADKRVVFSQKDTLIALDLMSGKEVWKNKIPFEGFDNPAVAFGGISFVGSHYAIAQDKVGIHGIDIAKEGTEIWHTEWNKDVQREMSSTSDLIGAANDIAYLFRYNPLTVCSVNLKDGSTQNVITLPDSAKLLNPFGTKGKGDYQFFILTPQGESPAIAFDE
jgi:hypothetical protein